MRYFSNRRAFHLAFILCTLTHLITDAASADPATADALQLYALSEGQVPAPLTAQRVDRIVIDTSPLEAAEAIIALPLPNGQVAYARRDHVEHHARGNLSWRGLVDGGGRVTLNLHQGVVTGRAETQDGPYEITTSPMGPLLIQLAMDKFQSCGNEAAPLHVLRERLESAPKLTGLGRGGGDPPDRIDVMILYTPDARDAAGGVAQIEATAQAAVDTANAAYFDSDMVQRLNLVHTELIDYAESGNVFTDLSFLESNAETATLRDAMSADMVAMITEDGGGFCGVAFLLQSDDDPGTASQNFAPFAFQVTARACAVGNFTYAHEHGHNMGFQHHPAAGAPPEEALFVHAFGHLVTDVARTVMSTDRECCSRVGHFSNPDVDFMPPAAPGNPSGIADARDNARVGDFVAPFAANWRRSPNIFVDGFESSDTSAWSLTIP